MSYLRSIREQYHKICTESGATRLRTGVSLSNPVMIEGARNLRTAERFLLAPPLAATFGTAPVAVCDISAKGARFRHDRALEAGAKSVLQIASAGVPVTLEATVVWTQPDPQFVGKFLSGVRTYGPAEVMQSLLAHLRTSHRTSRIEELRSTDRFSV